MQLNISIGRSNMDINRYYDAISGTGIVETQLFMNMKNHIAKLEQQPYDGAEASFGNLVADGTVNAILTDSINATNVSKEVLPQKGKIILEMVNKLQFMEMQHVFDANPELRNIISALGREIKMFMESSAQSVMSNLLLEKVCVKSVEALNNMRQVIEMADTQPKELWRPKAVAIGILADINPTSFVTEAYYKMKTSGLGQGQNVGAPSPVANVGNSFGTSANYGNILGDPNNNVGSNPFIQPTTAIGQTAGPSPVGFVQQDNNQYIGDYKIGSANVGGSYGNVNITPIGGNTYNTGSVNMTTPINVSPIQPVTSFSGTTNNVGMGGVSAGPSPVTTVYNPFTQNSNSGGFVVGGGESRNNNNINTNVLSLI